MSEIPTRFIEQDEFEGLIQQETGDLLMRYQLEGFAFYPPRPNEPFQYIDPKPTHLHVLFLNVATPVLYRDKRDGELLVILNKYGTYEFDFYSRIHPFGENAWYYSLAPHSWQMDEWDYPLDDSEFYFRDTALPAYNKERIETH